MDVELLLKEEQCKFSEELAHLPDEELVVRFNKQVRCLGGNNIRSIYLSALREEMLNRQFDSSIVINKCGLRLKQKVKLENNKLIFQ